MRIHGSSLVDGYGRTLLLRGVNLGGSSKVPASPDGYTHLPDSLRDHRRVSFIGRPFPLAEADEHFGRLESWGFTAARLLVTWEAIEHEGPGLYDEAYLEYLAEVAARAGNHGVSLIIDPHQDMWSRFSGGDGAPGWTLEAAGFELENLDATGAAVTHQHHGNPMPRVLWVTNGGKLAAATMFTLFFGGSDFAPRTRVNGLPIQEFLQQRYIAAFSRVADRLKHLSNVVGYGTMNEPLCGYIGWADLTVPCGQLTLGDGPTPFQGMLLGAGIAQEVGVWAMRTSGYLRPFLERFATAIRSASADALIFLEAEAGAAPPRWDAARFPGAVFAPHWYDDLTLVKNRYYSFAGLESGTHRFILGRRAVQRAFCRHLRALQRQARERMDGGPTVLAEFGIPFSMLRSAAFRTGAFSAQAKALDRSYRAIECALLGAVIWNYTPDNTHAHGDGWNGEDLSVFSRDDQHDPSRVDSGGRALGALLRPWPLAIAGEPLSVSFTRSGRIFRFEFRHDPSVHAPTEIYVPRFQYRDGCRVRVSDGTFDLDLAAQRLVYRHGTERRNHLLTIFPRRTGRDGP